MENGDLTAFSCLRWQQLWRASGLSGSAVSLFEDFANRYREPARHYHNARHIVECLEEFDAAPKEGVDPLSVEFAIWLHDAVYDPRRTDNEEQSAGLAATWFKEKPALAAQVSNLILATRDHLPRGSSDSALLIDIDLSILGKSPKRFAQYEIEIRAEYSWVPIQSYSEKRAAILRGFLERQKIFTTPHFSNRYEQQARRNLAELITQLEQQHRPPAQD
jgi:predicted metal-dependent HD superfamily phosphohydrolase